MGVRRPARRALGRFATITLNRPAMVNSLVGRSAEAISEARRDDLETVVIVTFADDCAFCTRVWLSCGPVSGTGGACSVRPLSQIPSIHAIGREPFRLDKPDPAAVNGMAPRAGKDLVSTADVRYASLFATRGLFSDVAEHLIGPGTGCPASRETGDRQMTFEDP